MIAAGALEYVLRMARRAYRGRGACHGFIDGWMYTLQDIARRQAGCRTGG